MRHWTPCLVGLLTLFFLLMGCSPFKPKEDPKIQPQLPKSYSVNSADFDPSWKWWKSFDDPELDALVENALTYNFSIRQAWFRLKQAEAVAVQAGANLYPDLTGEADAVRSRRRIKNGIEDTFSFSDYSVGFISRYEIDLWGRIRSEEEAALAESAATLEDFHVAANTVVAEIATRWVRIISQRKQKLLLENQLKTNRTILELIELRFRKSLSSALDVFQQQQLVEAVKAEIPLVEAEEKVLNNQLYLLTGMAPGKKMVVDRDSLPVLNDMPKTGIPADLLANRPDVRASGLRLMASQWNVAAAKANRLPALSLTGAARYDSSHLDILFENWILNLAAGLTAPIFDGGRRKAEVDRTEAGLQRLITAYRENVLTGVVEVEDALIRETKQIEHVEAQKRVIEVARKALDQAVERYRNGLSDYLPVLTQLLTVQTRERELIQKQALILIYRIELYRALGGTWMTDLDEPQQL